MKHVKPSIVTKTDHLSFFSEMTSDGSLNLAFVKKNLASGLLNLFPGRFWKILSNGPATDPMCVQWMVLQSEMGGENYFISQETLVQYSEQIKRITVTAVHSTCNLHVKRSETISTLGYFSLNVSELMTGRRCEKSTMD